MLEDNTDCAHIIHEFFFWNPGALLIRREIKLFGIEFSVEEKDSSEFKALAEKLGIEINGDAEKSILEVRSTARANKNFELADKIRDTLAEAGYTIEDTPQGSRIV